jgi:hypothetical protein
MMKRLYLFMAIVLLACAYGCMGDKAEQDKIKWKVTVDRSDKRPYGTFLAFESLRYYFPNAYTEPLPRDFRYNDMDSRMKYNRYGHNLLILAGLHFDLSDNEWATLKAFIKNGNEVVLFCSQFDHKIQDELDCYEQMDNDGATYKAGADSGVTLTLAGSPYKKYGYKGHSLAGYFTNRETLKPADSPGEHAATNDTETTASGSDSIGPATYASPDILGYADSQPDFVRYSIGDGHLSIHAAPLALSNYFLLQQDNKEYLAAVWRTLPDNITRIYWSDFYYRSPGPSGFDVLWRFSASRLAILAAIFTLLMYLFFEGKRKQRIIPVIPPLKNESVSFVETVGRLYYNKGNHANLEEKMAQQFTEWVRNHYFINTNLLDEHFIRQVTIKSGLPEATVRGLTDMLREIKSGTAKKEDAYLYQLYNTIQQFYKHNPQ